jgi:predicted nucleic acid-binding Zn ribbon protein
MAGLIALIRRSLSSPCSVCGQLLPLSAAFCSQCGLVPRWRRGRRRVPSAMIGLLGVGIVALAGIALSRHADAPVPMVTTDAAHPTGQLDADRGASVPELQDRIRRLEERVEAAEERPPYRLAPPADGWALAGMIAVSTLAALLFCALALRSERSRRRASFDDSELDATGRRPLVARLGYAGAGVSFAITVALAVILAGQSRAVAPASTAPPVATHLDELRDEVSALKRHLGLMTPSITGAIDSRAPALDPSPEQAGAEVARRQQRDSRAAPPPAAGPVVRPSGVVAQRRSPVTSKPGSTASAPRVKASAPSTPPPDGPTSTARVKASASSTASLADPAASIATPVPPAATVPQAAARPRPVTVLATPDPASDVEASGHSVTPSSQITPPASRTIRDDWKVLKRSVRSGADDVTQVFQRVRAWLTPD